MQVSTLLEFEALYLQVGYGFTCKVKYMLLNCLQSLLNIPCKIGAQDKIDRKALAAVDESYNGDHVTVPECMDTQ